MPMYSKKGTEYPQFWILDNDGDWVEVPNAPDHVWGQEAVWYGANTGGWYMRTTAPQDGNYTWDMPNKVWVKVS